MWREQERHSMPGIRRCSCQCSTSMPAGRASPASRRAARQPQAGEQVNHTHATSLVSTFVTSMPAAGTTRESRREVPP